MRDNLTELNALSLDEFSNLLIGHWSEAAVIDVVDDMVVKRINPPVSRVAMLEVLERAIPTAIAALERSRPS